jgi:hypothetical protein
MMKARCAGNLTLERHANGALVAWPIVAMFEDFSNLSVPIADPSGVNVYEFGAGIKPNYSKAILWYATGGSYFSRCP